MYFPIYLLIYFVEFSVCVLEHYPPDTVLSDSWDDCEAFHGDPDLSDEIMDDPVTFEDVVVIHESSESNQEKEKPLIKKKYKRNSRWVTINVGIGGNQEIFHTLTPAISNPANLSMNQLELNLYSLGEVHEWQELREYPLKEYNKHWGYTCDYFWKKPNPNDKRRRGCYTTSLLFPITQAGVMYFPSSNEPTKMDILHCKCYYYVRYRNIPDSKEVEFGVHKYKDNEYYILENLPYGKHCYKVFDFVTEAFLPSPII